MDVNTVQPSADLPQPRRKTGRPRVEEQPRSKIVATRLTEDHHAALDVLVQRRGISGAELIRRYLVGELRKEGLVKDDQDLIAA